MYYTDTWGIKATYGCGESGVSHAHLTDVTYVHVQNGGTYQLRRRDNHPYSILMQASPNNNYVGKKHINHCVNNEPEILHGNCMILSFLPDSIIYFRPQLCTLQCGWKKQSTFCSWAVYKRNYKVTFCLLES